MDDSQLPTTAFARVYGSWLLGTCISLVFYGLSLHQVRRYFYLYPTDALSIKTLVLLLMVLETLLSALLAHSCYNTLVTHYGKPSVLLYPVWSLKVSPIVVAMITCVAQAFFVRRVLLLGLKSRIAAGIAIIMLILHLGFAMATIIISSRYRGLNTIPPSQVWVFSALASTATAADALLSGAIIVGLWRSRVSRRGYGWSELFVLYVVNTGLLTGIVNAVPSILAGVSGDNLIWAAFNCIASRLYANTLFSVLNDRKSLASHDIWVFGPDPNVYGLIARANRLATQERWGAPQLPDSTPARINIAITSETEADGTVMSDSMRKVALD
ncbi:hypothetical protein C8Q70DRAFT_1058582 [Cubamyces menziesii]|uniref:DUF6534 domain-containing protein n=1 Tax=Trametes cubensis TaxID=1111947 RepID=A0AAD7U4V6_9APHY|nr:hypothetical protein C8Q70DRAFT_1058582 [Cubamyces menziesii]KAJ8502223.1 hypothetical protein ONZ51_g8 [Trametes cubensis]